MALRLGNMVISGELFNTQNYSVHGWLALHGADQPLVLNLTGNCGPDLRGKHIRFEARSVPECDVSNSCRADPDLSGIAWQQVGPTGTMTSARMVKVSDCPPAEFYIRSKLGEPPPTEWKRCLYLEWYSQNGRVVVELADPVLEFVDSEDPFADGMSPLELEQADSGLSGLDITAIHLDEEAGIHQAYTAQSEDVDREAHDDTFGLIPDELQRQLDAEARKIDRAIGSEEDESETIREMELMDHLIEHSDGEPVWSILDAPSKLPHPDDLDDQQVEGILKSILVQLALFGIALDVCEHCTPRDAYRMLIERVLKEERFHPELRQTQWVQHFMTHDFCKQCEVEAENKYEEYERRRKEDQSGSDNE